MDFIFHNMRSWIYIPGNRAANPTYLTVVQNVFIYICWRKVNYSENCYFVTFLFVKIESC